MRALLGILLGATAIDRIVCLRCYTPHLAVHVTKSSARTGPSYLCADSGSTRGSGAEVAEAPRKGRGRGRGRKADKRGNGKPNKF